MSEEIGLHENEMPLSSEIHLRNINNVIKGVIVDDFIEKNALNEKDDPDEKDNLDNYNDDEEIIVGGWTTWTEEIFLDAQEIACNSHNGSIVNAYYNPEAAKKIKDLMNYLPLWTGIMRTHFKRGSHIATSSNVEAEFSEIKTRVFKNQLPMRIDKFIIRHIEYLEGSLRLVGAPNQKSQLSKDISSPEKTLDAPIIYEDESFSIENDKRETIEAKDIENENDTAQDSLNEIENWRNKIKRKISVDENKKITKRVKQNCLTSCPDWDLITSHKTIGVPLLKNGNLCNATTIDKEQIVLRETCAFDSIFQVIANGIGLRDSYKTNIMAFIYSNQFIKFVVDTIKSGKITASVYCTRAKILCNIPIFNKNVYKVCIRNISSSNANCNVAHLAEYLLQDIPSCITTYNCNNCDHSYRRISPICNINVDIILQYGLNNMQQAITNDIITRKESTCSNCKQGINRNISYGSHLIIDTSIFSDHDYMHAQNINKENYHLENITKRVVIDKNHYSLSGIVSYIKYGSSYSSGHYIAFTYTGSNWYKYDDMTSKRSVANTEEKICQ